jgi:hypothetical protein
MYVYACDYICVYMYMDQVYNSGTVWGDLGEEGEEKRMLEGNNMEIHCICVEDGIMKQ